MGVINYICLLGYFILTCLYAYYSTLNLKETEYILFGSIIITVGYLILLINKFREKKEKNYEVKNGYLIEKQKNYQVEYGHLILFIFFILSYILPINNHMKDTNFFALFGHLILAFLILNDIDNWIATITKVIFIIFLIIYYIIYIYDNFHNISKHTVKAHLLGSALLIIYYSYEVYHEIIKQLEKDKENERKKEN